MATLTPYTFRNVSGLHDEMERLFQGVLGSGDGTPSTAGAFSPSLDVEEDENGFTLFVELPGVDPSDVEITLEENVITIAGERAFYGKRSQDSFRRVERRFGTFHRAVRLPDRVDGERVEASYDQGLLTITVPKSEDAKPRRISVTTTSA